MTRCHRRLCQCNLSSFPGKKETNKQKKRRAFTAFPHFLHFQNQTPVPGGRGRTAWVQRGEIYTFCPRLSGINGRDVRGRGGRKLTDGTLPAEPETGQSSWLDSNWTREAIGNARHSRPRPPSHIRNLRAQRSRQVSHTLGSLQIKYKNITHGSFFKAFQHLTAVMISSGCLFVAFSSTSSKIQALSKP